MKSNETYNECNGCGNKFSKRPCTRNGLLYCTVKCYQEYRLKAPLTYTGGKKCLCCNKPIVKLIGLREKGLYCDSVCYNEHRVNSGIKDKKKCLYCDNEIRATNKKYCNNKCYGKHKVELTALKKPNIVICENCEKPFDRKYAKRRKFCGRECYIEHKFKTKFTEEVRNKLIKGFNNLHENNMTIDSLSKSVGLSKVRVGEYFTTWLSNRSLLFNKEEYMKDLNFQMYSTNEMDYASDAKTNKKYSYYSLSESEQEIYNKLDGKEYIIWNNYYLK